MKNIHEFTCSRNFYLLQDFQSFWISYLGVTISSIFCFTSVLGNFLIIVALQNSALRPPSKMLFLFLALTDLCVGLVAQPCFVIYVTSMIEERFDICRIAEIVMQISSFALCGISLCTITLISMDRSLALLFGIRYRQIVTLKRVRSTMIIFWILLLSVSLLYLLKEDAFMITFCVFALFCLAVSTFSFLKIYFTLRHRQSQVVSQSEREHRQMSTRANVFKYKRTVALSVWIYLILTLCYLPFVVVQIVRALYGESISIVIAEGVTTSMMYHNSTINPLIYCWSMREVRQTVKSTIRKFCCLCC